MKSDRNKYMTQWLIGIFVHFKSSKDDLINCPGVGRLKRFGEPFQLFLFYGVLSHSLFIAQKHQLVMKLLISIDFDIIAITFLYQGGEIMKKRKLVIFFAITSVLVGGTIMSIQKQNIFSNGTQQSKQLSTKEKQLAYLQKHEYKIENFVKSQNPKIESVQIDWEETKWDEIGNGTPQGGGEIVQVYGGFNNISNSSWSAIIKFKDKKILIDYIGMGSPLRIGGELLD